MEGELVLVAIISTVGMIVITQLVTHNFFKKEIFKAKMQREKKLDSLKMKQLRKEMGLATKKDAAADPQQKLDLGPIINALSGGSGGGDELEDIDEEPNPIIDTIANIAKTNPELVNNVIGRITNKQGEDQEIRYLGE